MSPLSIGRFNWKRLIKYLLLFLITVIVLLVVLIILNSSSIKKVYQYAIDGKEDFLRAQNLIEEQDFSETTKALKSAEENFKKANEALNDLKEFKYLPLLRRQYQALDYMLLAGIQTASAISKISETASSIVIAIHKEGQDISLASITAEEQKIILQKIYESPPELQQAKAEIDLAVNSLNQIPSKGLLPQIVKAKEPFQKYLPQIQETINQIIPWAQTLPQIAGYPEERTYLFLLQNNTELRPTGGFIGTFGILKLKYGEIEEFHTENVYNLDNPVKDIKIAEPPWPLKKYLNADKWFFRDSNWSPDFPEAAQKAEWFYQQENGPEKNIHSVIAVTPTFIESLLGLTGEIAVDGITFNSENVVEILEYQVERGFYREGISDDERKEIIGILADKILEKLLTLPQDKWPDLWKVIEKDINEKQILVYLNDPEAQKLILEENWGGEIKQTDGDYLAIFDANLASLKTDLYIHRNIEYKLRTDSAGDLIAEVKMNYQSDANFDWKTTRYRTYVRFYVPAGSTLLEYSGFMENDLLHSKKAGEVEVIEELGKTRFGGFISIEPKASGTLTLKYKLPDRIRSQAETGYRLLVQKQPGTIEHGLNVDIDLGKKIKSYNPLDNFRKEDENKILFNTNLRTDREFSLFF